MAGIQGCRLSGYLAENLGYGQRVLLQSATLLPSCPLRLSMLPDCVTVPLCLLDRQAHRRWCDEFCKMDQRAPPRLVPAHVPGFE